MSNQEIANRLTIMRKTAGNHREHIDENIGVTNRARAALFAMKRGLMRNREPLGPTKLARSG